MAASSRPTVLVVEDETSYVEALTVGLTREGFRVEVATDGVEALGKFDLVRPDIVLLDVMLQKIAGAPRAMLFLQTLRDSVLTDLSV